MVTLHADNRRTPVQLTQEELQTAINAIRFASGQHPSIEYRYAAARVADKLQKLR